MRLFLIVLLLAVQSPAAGAQQGPPRSLWASLGAGGSAKGPVVMASASYSRGSAVVIGRLDATGGFTGPSVDDKAMLAGVRIGKGGRFALAAAGIGRSRSTYRSSESSATHYPPRTVLAFQVQGQPGLDATPLGIAILGVAGPAHASYLGAVLTLDFELSGGGGPPRASAPIRGHEPVP